MTRRVVVTGAHGFLGRHVARHFASVGWEVTGTGHGQWSHREQVQYGVAKWHGGDVTVDALATYAGEPDLIVHCAGSGTVSFSMLHPFEDWTRGVVTTAAVLEYIRLHSAGTKLVFPSSAAVYGSARKLPIAESDPLLPVSPYGVHKVMAEMLCNSYSATFDLTVGIIRFFSIYGEGLRKQLLWDACNKIAHGNGEFFGSGAELRDWLHVEDAARLIYAVADRLEQGCTTINGGSGEGITVRSVVETLIQESRTSMQPNFSGQTRPGDPPGYQAEMSRAHNFGWAAQIGWQEGMRRYVEWFRERGE
jgi:UDP-glucose 4-epimerase